MNSEQSHDKFFKETFSRTDITGDFLQAYLPEDIRAKLNLSSLRRETDSYTDEQLNEHFADLVFSITFDGKPIRVTLLLEHKSYPVKYPHFQLNRYLLNVWEQQIRQKNTLTPILPIIIYHGQSRWKKKTLSANFPGIATELIPYLPAFDYVLIDLGTIETMLPQLHSDYARLTGILLQYSRQKRMLTHMLAVHAQLIRNLTGTDTGRAFVSTTVIYLNWASKLTAVEIITIFEHISTEATELAMTAAQTWIKEGIQKGIEQGIEQGIRGMLKLGMDAHTIAAAFELPQETVDQFIQRIREKSE